MLYERVIRHELNLLLEYFPYHSPEEAMQLNIEPMDQVRQATKSQEDMIKSKVIALDAPVKEDLHALSEVLGWTLDQIGSDLATLLFSKKWISGK